MNIAVLSPSEKAYSETFIQAHKKLLEGNIFFYYSGSLPAQLEGKGDLKINLVEKVIQKIALKLGIQKFSNRELALIKSFKTHNVRVVLAEYGNTGSAVLQVCKKLKLPLVVHFHGFDASTKKVVEDNNYYKEVYSYASSIVVVSKRMKAVIEGYGCPEEKIFYNPCGPSEEFLRVKTSYSTNNFIAVGRFVNKKAPYYLILAFEKVVKEYPGAKLRMAGAGPLFEVCYNLIRAFKLENNVELLGIISPGEYQKILQDSLAFVQHSVTALNGDMEGTPVSLLEACAAGIPVISTYHAGIPDVIRNGYNGFLVEEHDIETMAAKMLMLIENKNRARELGENAKKTIKDGFQLKFHIEKLNDVIKKAAST